MSRVYFRNTQLITCSYKCHSSSVVKNYLEYTKAFPLNCTQLLMTELSFKSHKSKLTKVYFESPKSELKRHGSPIKNYCLLL